jgi:hypothetical protein
MLRVPLDQGQTPLDLAVELAHRAEGEEAVRIVTLLQLSRFSQEQEGSRSMRSSHSRTFGIDDGVRECQSPAMPRVKDPASASVAGNGRSSTAPVE